MAQHGIPDELSPLYGLGLPYTTRQNKRMLHDVDDDVQLHTGTPE